MIFLRRKNVINLKLDILKLTSKINFDIDDYYQNFFKKKLRKKAIEVINYHKKNGSIIFLCSAAPEFLLRNFADELNIDCISTRILFKDGFFQSRGLNCNGVEKLIRIKKYLRDNNIKEFLFEYYGDSNGDSQAFEFAQISHYKSFKKNEVLFKKESFFNKNISFLKLLIKSF